MTAEANRIIYRLQVGGQKLCEALRKIADFPCEEGSDAAKLVSIAKKALNAKEPEPKWSSVEGFI